MHRKSFLGALTAAVLATVGAIVITHFPARAATSEPYTWKNARIDGGGFVPGIIFNRTEPNLIYARTDIGGAYRWNQSTSSWKPLLDWVGWDKWGWNGVLSMATDPVQTDRVYAAVGMYLNSWDPNNGAILRSTDKGDTWAVTELPFKVGGNFPGRGMGERLAIDPNHNNVLYLGTEAGHGLWRSTDFGATWAKVNSFPNPGNYVQDPNDPNDYLNYNQGVVWVTFDEASDGIYVGVADLQNTVYRSLDGGTSWERIAGQPTGFIAHQGEVADGYLYITTSDKGGPYDGGNGQVWKYEVATGVWTDITPLSIDGSTTRWYGYSGLSVDRQHPDTIMVTGYSSWYPDTVIHRSTDGGATWRSFYDYAWPGRTNHYTLDISGVPWLDFNSSPSLPEQSPKLGWMTESLEIDPFDSDRMMFGTGATIYGTTNLTALDTGGTVDLRPMIRGLEETAVLELVSPPTGAPLLSGVGDIGGFCHTDLDVVPDMYNSPFFGATTSIDYAESNPNLVVRVGRGARTDSGQTNIGISNDNGANWYSGSAPSGAQGGTVALSANGSRVVWSTEANGVFYSTSLGGGFSQSSGVPATARVEADRVNSDKFYALANGTFYVSTNGGQSFTAAATGLPTDGRFKAMHGVEGDIWLAGETGIFRSTDSGASFNRLSNVSAGRNIGFGKAAPGSSYMALYAVATVDGVDGVFRSNDAGASWVRINDDQHQWGNMGEAITGDPRIYGRVYLGTNGRGVQVGDSTVIPPTPTASPTASPSASPSVSPSPSTSPTGQPGRSCSATYKITGQWPGGFGADVTVTNTGTVTMSGWRVDWVFTAGQSVTNLWNGNVVQSGSSVRVTNLSYNGNLGPSAATTFGFNGSWNSSANPVPTPITCTAF